MQVISQSSIRNWICNKIKEFMITKNQSLLVLPFKLDSDDYLEIYINKYRNGKIEISDGGGILGLLAKNYGIIEKDFNGDQDAFKDYIIDCYNLKFEKGMFSMETDQNDLFEDIMYFTQALIQLSILDAFQLEEREDKFGIKVYKDIKDYIPDLKGTTKLGFKSLYNDTTTYRKVDLYRENCFLYLAKTVSQKRTIDTAISTLSLVKDVENKRLKLSRFNLGKQIIKMVILKEEIEDVYLEHLKSLNTFIFYYPDQRKEIIKTFKSKTKQLTQLP
ncbi:MAG: DUF1828 domain-containing protein [Promethearchaeota archaeon]